MKLFNNLLAIQNDDNEIVIYDIIECKAIISFVDKDISFDLNITLAVLLNEGKPCLSVYEIKPEFELVTRKEFQELKIHHIFGTWKNNNK